MRVLWIYLILAAIVASCGVKGPPLPPESEPGPSSGASGVSGASGISGASGTTR